MHSKSTSTRFGKNKISKVISILVLQTFFITNLGFANVTDPVLKAKDIPEVHKNITEDISVPKDIGSVKSRYSGKDSKTVIHLQDAHCNYEAQQNISKILEHLIKNYNINFVAVEGADGVVDTSWFRAFPDAEIRKEVADYFMKKGEITGAEFLSITSDQSFTIYGAEDRKYYVDNLNSFLESYPYKEEFQKYYGSIKIVLQRLKKYVYNNELLELDKNTILHKEKEIKFADYVTYLNDLSKTKKINLDNYANFKTLTETLRYEKDIDFDAVNKERASLIDELSGKLTKEQLSELVNESVAFKVGKVEGNEFYSYLAKLAKENSISIAKNYNNLARYIMYARIYSRIDNEKLFDEIDILVTSLKETMFTNDDQRELDRLWRDVVIMIGFMNIELTNKEYEYFKENKEAFKPEEFINFISKNSSKFGLSYDIESTPPELSYVFPKLVDFYEIAMKRDDIIVKNMFKGMNGKDANTAVLITGGFHTKGISSILEQKDISYVVISPSITKEVDSPYLSVLTGQKTPFEELLVETEKTQLSPPSRLDDICDDLGVIRFRTKTLPLFMHDFAEEFAEHLMIYYTRSFSDTPKETIKKNLLKELKKACKKRAEKRPAFYEFVKDYIEKNFDKITLAEAYSSPEKFQDYVGAKVKDLAMAIPELEGMMRKYRAMQAGEEKVSLEKKINALIGEKYNAQIVKSMVGSLENLTEEHVVTDINTLAKFFESEDRERSERMARELMFSGGTGMICLYGGAASRLFGSGQEADASLSYFRHDVYQVARSRGIRIPDGSVEGISMGTRLAVQEWLNIEDGLKKYYKELGLRKTQDELKNERKRIVGETPRVIIINSESGQSIIKEMVDNNFYGYDPEITVFVVQSAYKGNDISSGKPVSVENSRAIPAGHGDATMQTVQNGRAFWVDLDGKIHIIKENAIEYLKEKKNEKIFIQSRVNDMLKLGSRVAEHPSLTITEVDGGIFALALSQMGDLDSLNTGSNVILEQVGQDKEHPIKGASPLRVRGREFLVEGLAQSSEVRALVTKEGVPFNRFFIFYKTKALTGILKKQGLPVYFRFRDGYLYPETVTGDITMLGGMNAGWALEPNRQINDYKDGEITIQNGLQAARKQDGNETFTGYASELTSSRKNVTITGFENAPGLEGLIHPMDDKVAIDDSDDTSRNPTGSGAIRLSGGELTLEEHRGEKSVNAAIEKLIRQGNAYAILKEGKTLENDIEITGHVTQQKLLNEIEGLGISIVIIRGLNQELENMDVATDLVLHPGSRRNSLYMDEKDYLYFMSLPEGVDLLVEAFIHEKAHIENPRLPEDIIEVLAPSHNARLALLTEGMKKQDLSKIERAYKGAYTDIVDKGKEHSPESLSKEYGISENVAAALLDKVAVESGYNKIKKEMYQSVIDNTPDVIKENLLVDLSESGEIDVTFTLENLEDFDPVNNPNGMNLRSWLKKYRSEASVSTAGIRGLQNILFPNDPRELIGQKGIILATVGKALVAKELQKKGFSDREIHKIATCEVRYNSKEFVELIARIQAAFGITTHLPINKETLSVWMTSFLIFKYDLFGGEFVTSSHAISKKIATKDLEEEGSQFTPDRSKLFVDEIVKIIDTIDRKGSFTVKLAPADDPKIDEEFMKKVNNGIDAYVEYLKQGIATEQNLSLIKQGKRKIWIDVVGGCMYGTMRKVFDKLGILEKFEWLHTKEDPYFHGIGKSCYRLKGGKLTFEDLSCDTSIISIHSREDVDKIIPILLDPNVKAAVAEKDIGVQVLVPVPESNSKIFTQIKSIKDPLLKLMDKENTMFLPLNKDKVLVIEMNKKVLPVIKTMGYEKSLKKVPVGTVVELTDPDGDRLITAEVTSADHIELLNTLGLAYERLDAKRVLVVFMPNQSFLATIDFRTKMLKENNEWDNRNWFMIKTTASAASWDDWAAAQSDKEYRIKRVGTDKWVTVKGVPVINTPVGFKEIASVMKKAEKQMREHPDKPVVIEDIFGNQIDIGVQPRLLFAGEESGGEIFGPTELIESVNGRKAIAMREKSAGEAMVITSAMAAHLEKNNLSLVQYLSEIFERNNIVNRYDYREDIIYFNESEPNITVRKQAEQEGLRMKEENDLFYLAVAIAIREGKITFEDAKTFMQKNFPNVNFNDLQAIHFVGDGVYFKFPDRIVEIRPSGTEAKTKGYALGNDPQVLIADAKELAGYYNEDMLDSLKELLGDDLHAEYFAPASFLGSEMPSVKVKALEIYQNYLMNGADTTPFMPPADYSYLVGTGTAAVPDASQNIQGNQTISVSYSGTDKEPTATLLQEARKMVSTMGKKIGKWLTDQFKDGKTTMLGWTRVTEWVKSFMLPQGVPNAGKNMLSTIKDFGQEVRESDITDVVFIGQGGSIECIKTMHSILGTKEGAPNIHLLDTVDNDVINWVKNSLDLKTTRFVVISKSVKTMETMSLYKIFFDLYSNKEEAVKHFTLIIDESKTETLSSNENVKDRGAENIFYIKEDVGGRYSWDTAINVLAASIMGYDVDELIKGASEMEDLSHDANIDNNPAAQLAIFKQMMQGDGRNRPVLLLPDELKAYGPWYGQLDVESLGKEATKSSLTIDHPVLSHVEKGTKKRFFMRIKNGSNDNSYDSLVASLEAQGYPVFTLTLPMGISAERRLGQLLKLSEFATAYTGYLMGVNPVNQPGVEDYKLAQKVNLEEGETTPTSNFVEGDNLMVDYNAAMGENKISERELKEVLDILGSNDAAAVVAALTYIAAKEKGRDYNVMMVFKRLTDYLRDMQTNWRKGIKDTLNIDPLAEEAPCILHAKQQGFQKGENSGFFTIVRFMNFDNPVTIPDTKDTFVDLIKAQAKGTMDALSADGRLGVLVSVKDTGEESLVALNDLMELSVRYLNLLNNGDMLSRIQNAEKNKTQPGELLDKNAANERTLLAVDPNHVIEKFTLGFNAVLQGGALMEVRPNKIYVHAGEADIFYPDEDGTPSQTLGEKDLVTIEPASRFVLQAKETSTVVYVEYEPSQAESMVIEGAQAVNSPQTQASFSAIADVNATDKPIVIFEPTTMHKGNGLALSKREIKKASNGTVKIRSYSDVRELAKIKHSDSNEYVYIIYTDDLKRIKDDDELKSILKNILTGKIIPVMSNDTQNITSGIANAREIETAALILGLTKPEELGVEIVSGNAITLQRIMSNLVGNPLEPNVLAALMGGDIRTINKRIEMLLDKLVPLVVQIGQELRARRQIYWSL